LVEDKQKEGMKTIRWDGTDNLGKIVNSGVYIYRIQTDKIVQNKKLLFIK